MCCSCSENYQNRTVRNRKPNSPIFSDLPNLVINRMFLVVKGKGQVPTGKMGDLLISAKYVLNVQGVTANGENSVFSQFVAGPEAPPKICSICFIMRKSLAVGCMDTVVVICVQGHSEVA
jgi:hypothetical protein